MTRLAVVTGAAGFIGSHLVDELLQAGWAVRCIDDLSSTGDWSNVSLSEVAAPFWQGDREKLRGLYSIDVRRINRAFFAGADVVFHLAALRSVPKSVADPRGTNEVNIDGTLSVLETAREAGVRRVVFASSSSVYGNQVQPLKVEEMIPNPESPYALQKLAGEQYCRLYRRLYGLETVCLRFFNVYGPRQDPRSEYAAVIPRFLEAHLTGKAGIVYGDGSQTRDFAYVSDVARACVAAADCKNAHGEPINVSTGVPTTVRGLWLKTAAAVGAMTPATLPIREPEHLAARRGDVLHTRGSTLVAQDELGWTARVQLEDGLLETARSLARRIL